MSGKLAMNTPRAKALQVSTLAADLTTECRTNERLSLFSHVIVDNYPK
jgi:hypothetical protein